MKALDNVSLRVRPGTVHALMGENGAGKSTLMKCLIGIYRPDKGAIKVKGQPVQFQDTMDALRSGISMIHQELNLVPHMTVAENIWLRPRADEVRLRRSPPADPPDPGAAE
ncbi:Galactose/methyl galactoside import ATP-binding protein MglA [Raoultella terrigena]|uniref:Ribose/galactose/methyl galactoside import ATP-binding protein n=1 Tax=Raoultella terrigena TaxID=577 RepID=A0A3P8JQ67_RAOTE|nr:Galactose/methyl galactoside import ATP-binding protein MglA [Raoultella terrigena]